MEKAQAIDVRPHIDGKYKIKFKLEVMPLKERIGGMRRLLSHNVEFGLSQAPQAERVVMASLGHMSLPELASIFPPLAAISCDGPDDVSLVNQCIVEELLQDICLLDFGHHSAATANLALWRSRGDHHPFVGEFAYQLRFDGPERHQPQIAAGLRALLPGAAAGRRRLAGAHHHQDRRGLSLERQPSSSARMSTPVALPTPPPPSLGGSSGSSSSWAPPAWAAAWSATCAPAWWCASAGSTTSPSSNCCRSARPCPGSTPPTWRSWSAIACAADGALCWPRWACACPARRS